MKNNFQKIIQDKDTSHISIGWTRDQKGSKFSVLMRMFDDEVASCHWFNTMEEVEKWLEEEVGVTEVPAILPLPLPLPISLPRV